MKTSLSLVFMISYFNFSICDNDHKALIFNRKTNPSLISIPDKGSLQAKCNTWASACPAATEDEKEFNEKYSLYNGALFVKKFYSEEDNCTDLQKDTCKEPYKLSMAWFKETIELGYELYFEHSESANSKFDINNAAIYEDYEPLKVFLNVESLSFMDKLKSMHTARKNNPGNTELKLKDKTMEFIWIPLFKLWFNAKRLRKIEYQIRKDNISPALQCEDYSLGQELIYEVDVDKLYSKEHQEERLKKLSVPPESAANGCEDEYKCLKKYLLLPSDQFQFGTNLSATPKCSNLATVPIWKSTLEGILKKLDAYLYILSRVSGEPLRIVAGVSGILSLPRSGIVLSTYVSLVDAETKFSIRAPKIIYKIVKIRTNKCQIKDHICWYGVLIVIHNDPHYDGNNTICEDVTDDWGWSEIKFDSYNVSDEEIPSKFIYACKINQKSIEAVGLTYRHDMFIDPLSLHHFPVYEGEKLTYVEMDSQVNIEMERMNNTGDSIRVDDVVIERPPIYDEDFDVLNDPDDTALEEGEDGEAKTFGDAALKKEQ